MATFDFVSGVWCTGSGYSIPCYLKIAGHAIFKDAMLFLGADTTTDILVTLDVQDNEEARYIDGFRDTSSFVAGWTMIPPARTFLDHLIRRGSGRLSPDLFEKNDFARMRNIPSVFSFFSRRADWLPHTQFDLRFLNMKPNPMYGYAQPAQAATPPHGPWGLIPKSYSGMLDDFAKLGKKVKGSCGATCLECKEFNDYGEPNQPDGKSHVCYSCRQAYKWKYGERVAF